MKYFAAFFWPAHLTADSDEKLLEGFPPQAAAGLLFIAVLAGTILWTRRHPLWRPAGFGLAWFAIALVPTAIMPLGEVANDHRMFFPFAGLSLAVSWSAWQLIAARAGWRRLAPAAAYVILALSGHATHARNEVWKTEETLWRDVTIKSPATAAAG